ncbi:hypothetical protein LTR64_004227 [Lithohypha guttulata]|uniref:uncharacterized protein n=1 Tax=Lithohypha guttulata TaxID=1690604 RepID=UPI002DDE9C8D|nr:hypothetical protein LTR51_006477 [Lithohypha guttulata]
MTPAAQGIENQAPAQRPWRENLNIHMTCPDCKIFPPDLIEDNADTICANCGRVLAERLVSYESEWRTFNNDEKGGEDPNRVGDAQNELMNSDTGTTIGGDSRNMTKQARSLKKAQAMQNEDKHNRALQAAYNQINVWADQDHFAHSVKLEAQRLYKTAYDSQMFRGKNTQAILASCLFISLRTRGTSRSFAEIVNLTRVPKKEIGRTFKQLENFFASDTEKKKERIQAEGLVADNSAEYIPTSSSNPKDLVSRYCAMLGLPFRISAVAMQLASKMSDTTGLTGRSPLSAASACIYFACHLLSKPKTLSEISQVTNVSDATIKQAYKKLYEYKDQLIEKDWKGPQQPSPKDRTREILFGDPSKLPKASLIALAASVVARPKSYDAQPYAKALKARQAPTNTTGLEVDLGYSIYQGRFNTTTNLNVFTGIRFAAPPTGSLRWQAPVAPPVDRGAPISASSYAPQCPQAPDASYSIVAVNNTASNEDCLFLNVWSPSNVTGPLPVLVWIHGGGYGAGNGRQDMSSIINTNGNQFVGVSIQYRLAAFGFLSSDEVYRNGVVNAGILDQHFALQWVQQYISQFNGDPARVTISGLSAGGGSVMLQAMAYGGSLGEATFSQAIANSPYLPMQYGYKDWIPSQSYYALATAAGCPATLPYGANGTQPIWDCLLNVPTDTLINASTRITQSGTYGTWAFLPVTDGVFVQDLPSQQLLRKRVNGLNILTSNAANEGLSFVPQLISSEDDLVAWLRLTFPLFSNNDIAKILLYYPSSNATTNSSEDVFATTGDSGPTALNQSNVGTGQQQRANNIYAETTFICPSYWLAEAYSDGDFGQGKAYKYQYSVLPATHGSDTALYFNPPGTPPYSQSFSRTVQQSWGNFIITGDPSISQAAASGQINGSSPITDWPPYSVYNPYQLDLNQTGGPTTRVNTSGLSLIQQTGEGTINDIRLVNAYTWEGGRGTRCDFWRSMGEIVPE